MRMWMIDPKLLCRQHLLGEHKEVHMLIGSINKGISIWGYLKKRIVEPKSIISRHKELVDEMISRGYNHKSPMRAKVKFANIPEEVKYTTVNIGQSVVDLIDRCPQCKRRIDNAISRRQNQNRKNRS